MPSGHHSTRARACAPHREAVPPARSAPAPLTPTVTSSLLLTSTPLCDDVTELGSSFSSPPPPTVSVSLIYRTALSPVLRWLTFLASGWGQQQHPDARSLAHHGHRTRTSQKPERNFMPNHGQPDSHLISTSSSCHTVATLASNHRRDRAGGLNELERLRSAASGVSLGDGRGGGENRATNALLCRKLR